MVKKSNRTKKGFTLVEVLVSITLFTAVAITGITAVLSAKSAYDKNRSLRAVTDSLMFVVEDFSRTARLGNYYHCISENAGSIILEDIETPQGNNFGELTCRGIAFEPFWNPGLGAEGEGDPEDQIIYVLATDANGVGALYVRNRVNQQGQGVIAIDDNPTFNEAFQRITPQSLDLDLDRSGFDVFYDTENVNQQPYIIFRINGLISSRGQETELSLQTSISQRAIRVE